MTNAAEETTGEWFDAMPGWGRGQRVVLATIGVLFCALIASAPVTWLLLRPVQTSSSVPPPQWTAQAFANGDAMRQLERHVKESSWVTFELRGRFNEALLQLGALASDRVVFGDDGWMFLAETMRWKPDLLERTRDRRRAILRQALDATRAVGIELLVVPTPDKVTIYSDHVIGGELDPGRERLYDVILDDLTAAGVPHIDVRALFREHRRLHPDELLYNQRGTHWQLAGQLLVAEAVRQRIDAEGWSDRVRIDPRIVVREPRARDRIPGLVRMLGLRCETETNDPSLPAVVRGLAEPWWWRPVFLQGADGQLAMLDVEYPDATVALCGTSFSETLGPQLCGTLRTLVDRRCVLAGGGSFRSMRKLAAEIANGAFLPRIVVWEFVQRDYQGDWTVAKSLFE